MGITTILSQDPTQPEKDNKKTTQNAEEKGGEEPHGLTSSKPEFAVEITNLLHTSFMLQKEVTSTLNYAEILDESPRLFGASLMRLIK